MDLAKFALLELILSRAEARARTEIFLKREQDAADLGANTYATHNCTKYFKKNKFADNFLFNAYERICFCF